MSAVTEMVPVERPAMVEVRCRDPYCRTLLFRYRPPANGAVQGWTEQEHRCPNRRCHRLQQVRVPVGIVALAPPVAMRED